MLKNSVIWCLLFTPKLKNAYSAKSLRVKSIDISDFRGIRKLEKPLNTDAEIVLITGPNGFGKTSLIDALCLLLTGFIHPCRDPIVFQLPNDGYFPPKATIKAVLLKTTGAEKDVTVTVPEKGPTESGEVIWHESRSAREITAKASFFYQDLIEEIFDNFTQGTTLKEFLAPPPKEVEDARTSIKKALAQVNQKEKNLAIDGFESEEELSRQREDIAAKVCELWQKLMLAVERFNIAPVSNFPQIDIFKRGGGLKTGWQENLGDFVLRFRRQMSLEVPDEKRESISILNDFKSMIDEFKIRYLLPESDMVERFNRLVAGLSDPSALLKLDEIATLQDKCLELENRLGEEKAKFELLAKLENYFKSPEEQPGLLEIMQSLRRHGLKWQQIEFRQNIPDDLVPPEDVLKWVKAASTSLTVDGRQLDEALADWQDRVENRRRELSLALVETEKEFNICKNDLRILEEINRLASTSAGGWELIKRAQEKVARRAEQIGPEQVYFDESGSEKEEKPIILAEAINKSLDQWVDIEKRDQERRESLKKSAQFTKAKEKIRVIRNALNMENDQNTSILESVHQLPESEARKLADLINRILKRFRLVEGIAPVYIRTSQRKLNRNVKKGTWEICTADGRKFTSLSTGQQSQLALSLLLALNLSLDIGFLRHGIIALDDTTTSFDMAQLPREAALLRQIAYGDGDTAGVQRQLFIVSHHEGLTHRLMDFLIPPQGKKMHVLNFVNWNPDSGPEIEQYQVEPVKSSRTGREELERFLKDVLKEDLC